MVQHCHLSIRFVFLNLQLHCNVLLYSILIAFKTHKFILDNKDTVRVIFLFCREELQNNNRRFRFYMKKLTSKCEF